MGLKGVLLVLVALLVLSQFLRFENVLSVKYDGENITASMGTEEVKFNYSNVTFSQVSARFQKFESGENGLRRIVISGDTEIFSYSRPVFYLFGRDIFGTMVNGNYKEINSTFGDWSMDTFISYRALIYNETLPNKFSIDAVFMGRGYKSLQLAGNRNVTFEIYDGLLGNMFCVSRGQTEYTYCICPGAECTLIYNDEREPLVWSIERILAFVVEIAIIVFFITLLVMLGSKGVKNE
jgi:hypothetical protein